MEKLRQKNTKKGKWPWVPVAKQKGNIMQKQKTQEATSGEENTFFQTFCGLYDLPVNVVLDK